MQESNASNEGSIMMSLFLIRNLGPSLASNYHLLINDVTIDGHIFSVWQLSETRTNPWQLSGRFLGLITVWSSQKNTKPGFDITYKTSNCQFFIGTFMKTTGSNGFSLVWLIFFKETSTGDSSLQGVTTPCDD